MKINLKTERLNIRLISELDIENVYNLQCLEETAKYNTSGIPQNIYETSVSVENGFLITAKKISSDILLQLN